MSERKYKGKIEILGEDELSSLIVKILKVDDFKNCIEFIKSDIDLIEFIQIFEKIKNGLFE
jgi:hypothetical protein